MRKRARNTKAALPESDDRGDRLPELIDEFLAVSAAWLREREWLRRGGPHRSDHVRSAQHRPTKFEIN
jgi:hypothetical protein